MNKEYQENNEDKLIIYYSIQRYSNLNVYRDIGEVVHISGADYVTPLVPCARCSGYTTLKRILFTIFLFQFECEFPAAMRTIHAPREENLWRDIFLTSIWIEV